MKIRQRIISVGLNRPPKPGHRVLPTAEVVLRHARDEQPEISHRIARTEAHGLGNVIFRLLGAADENLTQADDGMGLGKISIQRQRVFTFSDPLCCALREYFNKSQVHVCARMVRHQGQGFSQLGFGRSEGCRGIGHKGICARESVHARRSNERVDIVGIGGECAIEKAARLRDTVRGRTLIEPSQTLKIEIQRVRVRGLRGAARLGGGELGVQRVGQAPTISSCMSKRSARGLSKRSAQR